MTQVFAVVISIFALAVAIAGLVVQDRVNRQSRAVATVLSLINEYRDMIDDIERLDASASDLERAHHELGWEGLPTELRQSAWRISSYFDHVGVLVAHGLVPADPILGFFSRPIRRYWKMLRPVIAGEREIRRYGHQEYYEMLVDLTDLRPAPEIWDRQRLRLGLGRRVPEVSIAAVSRSPDRHP